MKKTISNLILKAALFGAAVLICLKFQGGAVSAKETAGNIRERVIENCGLGAEWTAYMAVYGHVYDGHMYFYKSDFDDMNIYRISVKDYKLEKYVSKAYSPKFMDNFVFYNRSGKEGLYAKNLDTGKTLKLTKDGWPSEVRLYGDRIYYVNRNDFNNQKLYTVKTDGTGKKLLAKGITAGGLPGDSENKFVFYEDRIYYMKSFGQYLWPKDGCKIYSCKPDGTDKKLMKKVKGTLGVVGLLVRDKDLLIGYYDSKNNGGLNYQRYNGLYRFNGEKFVKIGYIEDYPQYEKRMEDGYQYSVDDEKYHVKAVAESGRGLMIVRKDKSGNREVFADYPYFYASMAYTLEISEEYLIAYGQDGSRRDSVLIFDKNGDMIVRVYAAGFGDESSMHAAVVGDTAYIIHDHYTVKVASDSGETYKTVDKCEKIALDEALKAYEPFADVTMNDIQKKILKSIKKKGLNCKPGSASYKEYLDEEAGKKGDSFKTGDEALLLNAYRDAYEALFDDYLWVIRKLEDPEWGEDLEELDVERVLEGNDCIIYDEETGLYYFEPSASFLKLKVKDVYKNTAVS